MNHRPYPNANRARRQIERHDDETPPLSGNSGQASVITMPRLVIADEAREALSTRLAEVGASLRRGFLVPEDLRDAVERTRPVEVSLRPLADMLRERPVSGEETTGERGV